MNSSSRSKEFFELIKSIGESKSKQEEDSIISKEVELLKSRMAQATISDKLIREYLLRMIYIEMLGQDASFAHIHAVKLINSPNLLAKRIGYLSVQLCLHPEHELMLLLVNSFQKDLQSSNYLEVSMALHALSRLISKELVPALIGLVGVALAHKHASVRRKAVMVMHRFNQIDPESTATYLVQAKQLLCDRDPSVMGASLHLVHQLALQDPAAHKELVSGLVSILRQVVEHRLPREFDYHRLPAPWIQLKLLQILGVLGAVDSESSQLMAPILAEVLKRADIGINAGHAVLYECVRTITSIFPDTFLLEEAAKCVSRFIRAEVPNLVYLGLDALASIVQVSPQAALEHQLVVIECLEHQDESLRRKTLDLLYRMTNEDNVLVVAGKLLESFKTTQDAFLRKELVARISQLAESFAPDSFWYLDTMSELMFAAGETVDNSVSHGLIRLVAESDDLLEDGTSLQEYAAETMIKGLEKSRLSDVYCQTAAFILGEFGYLLEQDKATNALLDMLDRSFENPAETRKWILTALSKCWAKTGEIGERVQAVGKFQHSIDVDLQQRAHELFELLKAPETLSAAYPKEGCFHEFEMDKNLSFLDEYVKEALENGARPYSPPQDDDFTGRVTERVSQQELNFTPYTIPESNPAPSFSLESRDSHQHSQSALHHSVSRDGDSELLVVKKTGSARKWGPEGYNSADSVKESDGKQSLPHQQEQKQPEQKTVQESSQDQEPIRYTPSPLNQKPLFTPREIPKEPQVSQEKQKLAAALFSGVSKTSSSKSKTTRSKHRSTPKEKETSSAASVSAVSTPVDDLLDFNFGTSEKVDTFETTENISTSELISTESHDSPFDDLFDIPITSQPSQPTSGHQAMSDQLLTRIESFPRSSEYDQQLTSDSHLTLSSYTIWAPQQTIVALFATNHTASPISDISFAFTLPKGMQVGYDGEPSLSLQGRDVLIPHLDAFSSGVVLVTLSATITSTFQFSSISGKCSFSPLQQLPFDISLSLHDFIRPLEIPTKEFARNWKTLGNDNEKRFNTPEKFSTPEQLVQALQEKTAFHPVQTIGKEVIAAGYLADGTSSFSQVMCVHVKLSAPVSVILRSPSKALSERLAAEFTTFLS